jgi:hypothetical protein
MPQWVYARAEHILILLQIIARIEQRVREMALAESKPDIVHGWIETACRRIRIARKVPSLIEERARGKLSRDTPRRLSKAEY